MNHQRQKSSYKPQLLQAGVQCQPLAQLASASVIHKVVFLQIASDMGNFLKTKTQKMIKKLTRCSSCRLLFAFSSCPNQHAPSSLTRLLLCKSHVNATHSKHAK
jgi:hypothetical protein